MSFLPAFQHVSAAFPDALTLIGDCMLVEEIPAEEVKSKGGIIVGITPLRQVDGIEANRPCFVRVLQIGKGFYDETDNTEIALDTKPGDICLVGKLSVKWLSVFGPILSTPEHQLGLVREADIQARFAGQKAYDEYFDSLKANLTNG